MGACCGDTCQVDEKLFEMEEERELWDAYRGAKEKLPPGTLSGTGVFRVFIKGFLKGWGLEMRALRNCVSSSGSIRV